MSLTAGIVGLPNVGKSTLFNAITKSQVEAANYPFATIDKNVGVVTVPDPRVGRLSAIFNPKKTIYTTFEFTDIAGLVKGASEGEGLGNKFLGHIREVDAICHVVRCFHDEDISHVAGRIDPIEDIEVVELELLLADIQTVDNRFEKLEKKLKNDKSVGMEYDALKKIKQALDAGKPASSVSLNPEEEKLIKTYHLLTKKPMIYVANIDEVDVAQPENNADFLKVKAYAQEVNRSVVAISAHMEEELSSLDDEETALFLEDLGLHSSGLDKIVHEAYSILGLKTFFTVGSDEVRAWTFHEQMTAFDCAGIIHSDFQRGFIRAETYHVDDLFELKTELAIKEKGRLRLEGKQYLVHDGDVLHFRFNV
ncbi:MAG TPA: redox-regulated ATPase YchF [Erysipelothrix sp.]|nr:redox-regulated ATPase YchF [Erysipelothrix sp.]